MFQVYNVQDSNSIEMFLMWLYDMMVENSHHFSEKLIKSTMMFWGITHSICSHIALEKLSQLASTSSQS